jgi:fatty-acyl-CoA synthase
MLEYWGQPAATAEAFTGDWFHTGDIGHLDREGFLYIDDRKKEVIISGGENVYPAEVESLLAAHPALAEVAVVARADARWGEVPVAVVSIRPGHSIDKAALLRSFEGQLARFKHPRDVVVVDALPRNVMGKILKYKVRELV